MHGYELASPSASKCCVASCVPWERLRFGLTLSCTTLLPPKPSDRFCLVAAGLSSPDSEEEPRSFFFLATFCGRPSILEGGPRDRGPAEGTLEGGPRDRGPADQTALQVRLYDGSMQTNARVFVGGRAWGSPNRPNILGPSTRGRQLCITLTQWRGCTVSIRT